MTDWLASRVKARLRSIHDAGLERALRPPAGIDLSSNDYLGLANDPRVVEALITGARRDGCGSTGSRLLRGDREAFERVEARFASFKGTDRALYFSSGYLANIAVITTFAERGDIVFSDERNHASLIDAVRLSPAERVVFPHNDVHALDQLIGERSASGRAFVVVESVFSMDGDFAPLVEYAEICRRHGAGLVVDEAHAVGLYGERGSGRTEALGLDRDVTFSINSAGKALGVSGAFVAGPAWAVEYLVQRARPFIFSTAAPPAIASAIEASLDIVATEPGRRALVMRRSGTMRRSLQAAGVSVRDDESPIVPIVIGENDRAMHVAAALQAAGFDIRAIRPPTVPAGTARLRLSVHATLDEGMIDRVVRALADALQGARPWSAVSS